MRVEYEERTSLSCSSLFRLYISILYVVVYNRYVLCRDI